MYYFYITLCIVCVYMCTNHCHWVFTQLQLANISISTSFSQDSKAGFAVSGWQHAVYLSNVYNLTIMGIKYFFFFPLKLWSTFNDVCCFTKFRIAYFLNKIRRAIIFTTMDVA
jgi:hypothetical protein